MATVALAVLPKVSSGLSVLGSSFIIHEFLRRRRKRRKAIHHRLLFGMSAIDVLTSTAIFFTTWPIPSSSDAAFASGNERTCAAQGFFLQFGMAMPIYNMNLSLYYYLVTTSQGKGKNEKVYKLEPLLHAVPWIIGISTATTGLFFDLYHEAGSWCWIGASKDSENNFQEFRVYMYYTPILFSISMAILFMFLLYSSVRMQEKRAKQWKLKGRDAKLDEKERKVSRKVAAQAFWYVAALLITFLPASVTRFYEFFRRSSTIMNVPKGLSVLFVITLPAQGFFNFLVYNRGRYIRYREKHPDSSLWELSWNLVRKSLTSRQRVEPSVPTDTVVSYDSNVDPLAYLQEIKRRRCDKEGRGPDGDSIDEENDTQRDSVDVENDATAHLPITDSLHGDEESQDQHLDRGGPRAVVPQSVVQL